MDKLAEPSDILSADTEIQENSRLSSCTRHFMPWLSAMVVVLLIIHLIMQYLNIEIFAQQNGQIYELSNRFDFDDESSLPTWFAQAMFLIIGVLSLLVAHLTTAKLKRRLWQMIGVIALVVSIDEVATFHEYVLQVIHVIFFGDSDSLLFANAWWVVLPFIIVAAGWLLYLLIKLFPQRTVWIMALGGAVLIAGGAGIDLLTVSIDENSFQSQGIMVAIEEAFELSGGLIVLYAVLDYLQRYHGEQLSDAIKQLKRSSKDNQDMA